MKREEMTLSEFYRSPIYKGPKCGNINPLILHNERHTKVTYTGSNQRIPEFHSWACLVRGMGASSYVELGCGSAWSLQEAGIPHIVTVDLLPNGLGGIRHIQGNSHDGETVLQVLDFFNNQNPDVVFIDADHSYEGCKKDFELWYPLAGMAVGFHDTRLNEGCDRFWREVSKQYPSVEIVGQDHASAAKWQGSHNDGQVNAGGIGVIYKSL